MQFDKGTMMIRNEDEHEDEDVKAQVDNFIREYLRHWAFAYVCVQARQERSWKNSTNKIQVAGP